MTTGMTIANQLPHVKTEKPEMGLVSDLLSPQIPPGQTACPSLSWIGSTFKQQDSSKSSSQCKRTKKSFFLKRLSRLHSECPELGRERVRLTQSSMNGTKAKTEYHWKPMDELYFCKTNDQQ